MPKEYVFIPILFLVTSLPIAVDIDVARREKLKPWHIASWLACVVAAAGIWIYGFKTHDVNSPAGLMLDIGAWVGIIANLFASRWALGKAGIKLSADD